MKKVKWIVIFIAMIAGFIGESEIFQSELNNYSAAYYYTATVKPSNENGMIEYIDVIEKSASEYSLGVLTETSYALSNHEIEQRIYANSIAREEIKNRFGIESKKYRSAISGNTVVKVEDFRNLMEDDFFSNNDITFVGDKDDIFACVKRIRKEVPISKPKIWGGSMRDMLVEIWVFISILLVVLTIFQIFFEQKECMLRIFYGENPLYLWLYTIGTEFVSLCVCFFLSSTIVFSVVDGNYMNNELFYIMLAGYIVCCVCYTYMFFVDIKKVFHRLIMEKKYCLCYMA